MNLLLLAFMYGLHVSYCFKCSCFKTDQNSDLNMFGRINELLIISIFEDHILLCS